MLKVVRLHVLWMIAGVLPAASVNAADETAPLVAENYTVERATSEFSIDGVLDEPGWETATLIPSPYEWQPGDNVEPPVATDGLVTYDDRNVYIAFRAHDPEPSRIRAHLMDRDSIETFVQDDHVVILLDTFNDERRAFQFRVNPLGVQADAINSEADGIEDWSWNLIWDSAGRIGDRGYVVEIAIPLNQLRFPQSAGSQTWGIELGRSYPRNVRHRMASHPTDRNRNCGMCQFNKITGFEGLEPGLNLELDPTLTATRTDASSGFSDDDLVSGDEEIEAGLSLRWGITPNLSANATINPDFSQVEADVAQLDVNERFALFFPETRPFFLDGIDYFATPIDAVFTRTVVDPDWGAKLTGKVGKNTVGVFLTEDDENNLVIPSNQRSDLATAEGTVSGSVLRYRRDVGARSTIGLLYTGREGTDYHNRVGGIDGFIRFSGTETLRFQYLRSNTLYPDQIVQDFAQPDGTFDGDGLDLDYDHASRHWQASLAYTDLDTGFRADSGFVPRVDVRTGSGFIQRRFWGEEGDWYTQANVGLLFRRTEDQSGRLTDESIDLYANFAASRQSFLEVAIVRNKEYVEPILYEDLDRLQAFFQIQPSGLVRFSLFADVGETVDVNFNQRADMLLLVPTLELKLGRHVNALLDHTFQRLDVDAGELFTLNLTQLRLIYNFTVRSFVRGIFQYRDYDFDPTQFGVAKVERLYSELLFSYKVNPQTVAFVGYSDDREGDDLIGLTQTRRTFFVKFGYAWIL